MEEVKHFFKVQEAIEGAVWLTHWKDPGFTVDPPPHDYRDTLPLRPEDIAELYAPVVREGSWTFGLVQCWGKRSKLARSAVHIPCCPSFNPNPLKWRGWCFGRQAMECFWFGVDRVRWARLTHALRLGREYTEPFQGFGKGDKHEICSLCWFQCCLGIALTLGVGQFFTICGNYGLNCAACYTCHAREKLRRRYKLPPAFGLPPGIDDCLTHLICLYCATHQEIREAMARGLDGPGISPLDVHPQSWAHLPGFEAEMAHRREKLAAIEECGINFPPFEQRMERDLRSWHEHMHAKRKAGGPHDNAFITSAAAVAAQENGVQQQRREELEAAEPEDGMLASLDMDAGRRLIRSNSVAY